LWDSRTSALSLSAKSLTLELGAKKKALGRAFGLLDWLRGVFLPIQKAVALIFLGLDHLSGLSFHDPFGCVVVMESLPGNPSRRKIGAA
jgi:hypothetical protein